MDESAHEQYVKRLKVIESPIDLEPWTSPCILPCCGCFISGHDFDRMQQSDTLRNRCPLCRRDFYPADVVKTSAQLNQLILDYKNQSRRDIYKALKYKTLAEFHRVHFKTLDALMAPNKLTVSKSEIFEYVNQEFGEHYQQMITLQGELTCVLDREEKTDAARVKSQETLLNKSRELQEIQKQFNRQLPTMNHVHTALTNMYGKCVEENASDKHSEWLRNQLHMLRDVVPPLGEDMHACS